MHKGKCMKEREIKTPDPAPKGGGRSKKEAEQQAAREALELMGY